ncbi:MAG TPA: hypothetical protein VN428_10780 [Bryobacteraceae bacterium]|nr:hypothetical protein [Bryobacteraceae bacterium]
MPIQIYVPKRIILGVAMLAWPILAAEDHPRAEVFGGFQYIRVGAAPGLGANGFNAAITGNVNRWLGLTADVSGAYRGVGGIGLTANTLGFGPSVALRGERVTPFAHLLLGGFRGATGFGDFSVGLTGFAMLAGGGVDVRVSKRMAVRLFQLDWIVWNGAGMTEKKNARISGGVVFRIN